ncbi:MAG: alpha/beta hydrolase [Cyclobacteriaceae bacterium]|nr:alpha/beta hydrolase [Cyclobacteriaceae bacterium]
MGNFYLKYSHHSISGPESWIRGIMTIFLIFITLIPGISDSIDEYFLENIGGIKQAILIRGENTENPVMLRLHGGPGYPYFPYLPEDGPLRDLEKHFTMIYWEQRGTGASFSHKLKKSSMNVERFVEDAREVIRFVKKKMNVNAVYIWGHSWGSNIGILLAEKYPGEIIAYIGTGQSVDPLENERACYQHALEKTSGENNLKGLKELNKIDTANYGLKDALKVRKWLYSYGGVIFSNGDERSYIDEKMVRRIWQTPQYRLSHKLNIIFHPYYSGRHLWDDMKAINLIEQAPEIQVPVYFLLGRHDRIVSSRIAAEYFERLQAPAGKQLIWFDYSAHRPHTEEPDKFFHTLVDKILPETQNRIRIPDSSVTEKE